jgi:hypothetical protein
MYDMRWLILFHQGLGDCVQLAIVVKHIKAYRPHDFVAVVAKPGRESVFLGLADQVWPFVHPQMWREPTQHWDRIEELLWNRPTCNHLTGPSTKVTECLVNEIGLRPIPELYRYEMQPQPEAERQAEAFIAQRKLGRYAFCHFFSGLSEENKHLTDEEGDCIIDTLQGQGLTPVVLEARSRWKPKPGVVVIDRLYYDAQFLRSLIARATCCHAIDSGPAHVAATTETPTTVYWKGTVAPYCFDPCGNVTHVVPEDFPARMFDFDRAEVVSNFHRDYRSETYSGSLLSVLQANSK